MNFGDLTAYLTYGSLGLSISNNTLKVPPPFLPRHPWEAMWGVGKRGREVDNDLASFLSWFPMGK
jgi:hypothetical protein